MELSLVSEACTEKLRGYLGGSPLAFRLYPVPDGQACSATAAADVDAGLGHAFRVQKLIQIGIG